MVSFFPSFISGAHGASPLFQACNRDIEMPPWVASNLKALTVMVGYPWAQRWGTDRRGPLRKSADHSQWDSDAPSVHTLGHTRVDARADTGTIA